jgi:hypothetical protein
MRKAHLNKKGPSFGGVKKAWVLPCKQSHEGALPFTSTNFGT